jgi:hypothetical protein
MFIANSQKKISIEINVISRLLINVTIDWSSIDQYQSIPININQLTDIDWYQLFDWVSDINLVG